MSDYETIRDNLETELENDTTLTTEGASGEGRSLTRTRLLDRLAALEKLEAADSRSVTPRVAAVKLDDVW